MSCCLSRFSWTVPSAADAAGAGAADKHAARTTNVRERRDQPHSNITDLPIDRDTPAPTTDRHAAALRAATCLGSLPCSSTHRAVRLYVRWEIWVVPNQARPSVPSKGGKSRHRRRNQCAVARPRRAMPLARSARPHNTGNRGRIVRSCRERDGPDPRSRPPHSTRHRHKGPRQRRKRCQPSRRSGRSIRQAREAAVRGAAFSERIGGAPEIQAPQMWSARPSAASAASLTASFKVGCA